MIFLSMSSMNIAKILVLFFLKQFNKVWKKAAFMLWIENNSFWMIKAECLSILSNLLWIAEEIEVDHNQLECFEFNEIKKIEIEVFNWSLNTIVSWCMFNNISFLFIQSLLNMTSWCSMSVISIDTINFLWLSMIKLDRILWVIIFWDSFSSYSCISFFLINKVNCKLSFWQIWSARLICINV